MCVHSGNGLQGGTCGEGVYRVRRSVRLELAYLSLSAAHHRVAPLLLSPALQRGASMACSRACVSGAVCKGERTVEAKADDDA